MVLYSAYKVVYKALDRKEGYEVTWNGYQTAIAEYIELNDEIEVLKRVKHLNIINFYEYNLFLYDNIFINVALDEVKIVDLGIVKMKKGKNYRVIGTPVRKLMFTYLECTYLKCECKNAAQVYKKVTQDIKPVLDTINNCLLPENERYSFIVIIFESSLFLAEPEVLLLSVNERKNYHTMKIVLKKMDRLSVKVEFDNDTDTTEDVVNEMIEEKVERFQQLITSENRILRESNEYASGICDENEDKTTLEKELATSDERLEQQLAQKERELENEKMLFNNSSAEQDIPLIQILKKYSYNDIREELAEERYTYKEVHDED
ncbi:hypothetical protein H8356DRAFT_1330419 [Neocallimastix lanati (nom. inval.)]|nr:hypothetical protein H8356DRAFT_1330419 [Neocallimastix sp. JGI-2020a]